MLVPDTPSARCQRPLGVPRVLHITPRLWSLPPGEKCHGLAILPAAVFPCSFLHAAQRLKERGRPAAPRVLLLLLPPPGWQESSSRHRQLHFIVSLWLGRQCRM